MKKTVSLFIKYVSSNVLGMLGVSCYILADTVFIARGAGEVGLTALNLAIPVFSLINGTGLMLGIGGATRFSLTGDKQTFAKTLSWTMIISVLFSLIGIFFSDPIAFALGADESTLEKTATYLGILLLFSPAFMLNNLVSSFVRNDSEPHLAMRAMLLGSFSNIILDYVFIFPLKMGIFGAALATAVSPVISLAVLSRHFIKGNNTFELRFGALNPKTLAAVCPLGVSALITELSSGIVMVVFNLIILRLAGNTGVAAYDVIANIAMVLISVFNGIANGCQPIFSKALSAGNKNQIQQTVRLGIITCEAFALLFLLVLNLFAEPITSLFNAKNNARLTEMTVQGMHIYFLSFLFSCINIFVCAYTAAVDRPKYGFFISLCRGILVIVPCAFLLSALLGMTGVWLSIVVCEAIVLLFSLYALKKAV